ncbi:MAG: ferredoxin reductase [Deltaproteobacteria bacterium]
MTKVASIWSRLGEVASLVATPLLPAHYVELLAPLASSRKARVEEVRDEAPGVKTIVLRPGRGWRGHRAGQHVRVSVAIDGRLVARTYSISSAPERRGGCIDITVKAQGRVSNALHAIEVGAFVTLGAANGEFVLPGGQRILFVTGGSGITPIAAMLRSLAARKAMADVVHVHYARTANDVIFGEELRSLAVDHPGYRLVEIYTASDRRRFDARRLGALVPDWQTREAWACGPQSLLDAVGGVYTSPPHVGHDPRSTNGESHVGQLPRLHVERFRAALAVLPANASGGRVRFATSAPQQSIEADAATPLLLVAERAGLTPKSGCRMGICHTCDCTLVAGCVRDLRTGAAIDEPGVRVQICVCAAAGDVELAL